MPLSLVPYPVALTRRRGYFALADAGARLDARSWDDAAIREQLRRLGLQARPGAPESCLCLIGSPSLDGLAAPERPEGYALRCDRGGIAIRGQDRHGLFWGLATLAQLLGRDRRVPCLEIHDYPAFAWRYHHDDISRKQVSSLADFRRIIRQLSAYKVRYYTLYLEDMLYLPSHPDIGRGRGRLTPAELRALHAEAKRANVTPVPTFSLLGHQENLLRQPRYRHLARKVFQAPSTFDPAQPALQPFLREVIADVCRLFPDAPFFHAGFDETQGLDADTLIAHANWCAEELCRHGKQMLMWVDMFKNHFGIGNLQRLSSNILPVEWNYGDPAPVVPAYRQAGIRPLGLAGYQNWGTFLPDFRRAKDNLAQWAAAARQLESPGFGASMWGDDGYENSRDLCWNLFACYAEHAWRGGPGPDDFEKRFQATFYGRPLPALAPRVLDLAQQRSLTPRLAWQLFRLPQAALVRRVAMDAGLAQAAAHDRPLLRQALAALPGCRRQALREAAHLDHFEVALRRELDLVERLLLARRMAEGLSGRSLAAALRSATRRLLATRDRYREVWLRHNKRPNLEVSLAVYERIAASLAESAATEPPGGPRWQELDLAPHFNLFFQDVAGIPLRRQEIHEVPFRFAPRHWTHRVLRPGERLELPLALPAGARIKDLHLIYGGQTLYRKEIFESLEVVLARGGQIVFREALRNVADLCCWWAPMGEHIWAGGGYRYVDQRRNRLALSPAPYYGLMHLNGFKLGRGVTADSLQLLSLDGEEIALFALTLELQL